MRTYLLVGAALAVGLACNPTTDAGADEGATESGSASTGGETSTGADGTTGASTTAGLTSAGDGDGDTGDGDGTTGGTTGGGTPNPVDCGNNTYACGDGIDNDQDGLIDSYDPECTGPCDDDEGSFATGIPGDNMDCWQDCFFDGNSGQGGGDCRWNLKCDPANPGANIGCEYTPNSMSCMNQPPDTSDTCLENCGGLTPNGCDCFGCCEVPLPAGGTTFIFLNSGPDCSLDNLAACQACTPVDACLNTCEPSECELCFGQSELPPGCTTPTCPAGQESCNTNPEEPPCPGTEYCLSGCCTDFTPPD